MITYVLFLLFDITSLSIYETHVRTYVVFFIILIARFIELSWCVTNSPYISTRRHKSIQYSQTQTKEDKETERATMAEFAVGLTKTAVEGTLSLVKTVVEARRRGGSRTRYRTTWCSSPASSR